MAERLFTEWAVFLERLIRDRGISQSDIARALGVSPSRVSEWKNGKARPYVENLATMAQVFGLDLDSLLTMCRYPVGAQAASDPDENEVLAIYRLIPTERRDTVKYMLRGVAAQSVTPPVGRGLANGPRDGAGNRRRARPAQLDHPARPVDETGENGRINPWQQSVNVLRVGVPALLKRLIAQDHPKPAMIGV